MRKFNDKSGFTLIEIIVVLIIVGVLAAIALPNLFSNVTRSKAGEGVAALGPWKSQIEGCMTGHPGSENASCAGLAQAATKNFGYSFATALVNGTSGGNYVLQASDLTTAANFITLTKSTATGGFACAGAGSYVGVC